jgi:uncharacterized protein YkwD
MISRALRLAVPVALVAAFAIAGPAQADSPPAQIAQAVNASLVARGLPQMPQAQALATPQAKMYQALNTARIHNGLPPFQISTSLTLATTHWVRICARRKLFQHERVLTVPGFPFVGDILARSPGKKPGVQAVVDAWMASPDHSPIILDRRFNTMGVAVYPGRYKHGKWWMVWDVRFGQV